MKKRNRIVSYQRLAGLPAFLAAMLCGMNAIADEAVWKCGNTYTDRPQGSSRQKCSDVSNATVPGFKGELKSGAAERKSGQAAAGVPQASRDRESRQILEGELASLTARRNALRDSLQSTAMKSGGPLTAEDVQAQARAQELSRLDTDIEGLRREIARLPADKAQPAP